MDKKIVFFSGFILIYYVFYCIYLVQPQLLNFLKPFFKKRFV